MVGGITKDSVLVLSKLLNSSSLSDNIYTEALKLIYEMAFLPMVLYAIPIWFDGLRIKSNLKKIVRIQRLMAIRIVKGYRTISNEAACLLAGVAPIYLKAEELVKLNMIKRGSGAEGIIYPDRLEKPVNYKQWIHPALLVDVKEETNPETADCEVCLAIERSSAKNPPSLIAAPRLPPYMSGEWVSTRCETRPMGLFLRRRLRVSGRTWHAEFRFFSDPKCTAATLVAAAEGRYVAAKLPPGGGQRVPGAVDFDFMVDRGFLTLHDKGLVTSLQKDKKCGPPGVWQLGVKRDLTPSKGCPPLGIVIPTTEYELVRLEVDQSGNTLLLLGHSDRDTMKNGGNEIKKRPTTFQPPLLQCNAPELPPLTHFLNSYNIGTRLRPLFIILFTITLLVVILPT